MKYIFCYLCVSLALSLSAQTQLNTKTSPGVRPSYIGLFVHDIQAMKEWYETKLGFKTIQYKKISNELGFAMMEWNGIWIEMIQNPKTVSRKSFQTNFPQSKDLEGFFKLGFYSENLEQLETDFKAKGIPFKYPMMSNDNFKMKLFIIEDPEGNWIQFYNTKKEKMEISGHAFWAVAATDILKTSEWYERVFQLKLMKEIKDESMKVRVRIVGNEYFTVEILLASGAESSTDMTKNQLFKAGFYVNDIELAEAFFKEKGVKIKYGIFSDAETQMKSFIFEDPNKILIQVLERTYP